MYKYFIIQENARTGVRPNVKAGDGSFPSPEAAMMAAVQEFRDLPWRGDFIEVQCQDGTQLRFRPTRIVGQPPCLRRGGNHCRVLPHGASLRHEDEASFYGQDGPFRISVAYGDGQGSAFDTDVEGSFVEIVSSGSPEQFAVTRIWVPS